MKYFNFLLENDINFKQDETGNYSALVKVFNPEYYKDKETAKNKPEKKNFELEKNVTKSDPRLYRSASAKGTIISNNTNNQSTMKLDNENNDNKKNQTLINYNEIFSRRYKNFFKNLNPLIGIRGKKLNLYNLKYIIEEIYSIRFIKDTCSLKSQLTRDKEIDMKDPFPMFVLDFLMKKYIKKSMIDRHALDLLISIEFYKDQEKDVEIFSRFMDQTYDLDDLIFFLFVRSCIEKEMKIMFIEKAKDEIRLQFNENRDDDNEIYLNKKVCLKIANTIFGSEEQVLLNTFQEKIEKFMVTTRHGKSMIRASTVLFITLQDYHQSRQHYKNEANHHADKNNDKTQDGNYSNLSKYDDEYKNEMERNNNLDNYSENQPVIHDKNSNKGAYEVNKNQFYSFKNPDNMFNNNLNNIAANFNNQQHPEMINHEKYYSQNTPILNNPNFLINKDDCIISANKNINNHDINDYDIKKIESERSFNTEKKNFQNNLKSNLKLLISNFIKGKELDIFFNSLLISYSIHVNEDERINLIISKIKDIISKKLDILINILFNEDKMAWCSALDINSKDQDSLRHYDQLIKILKFMQNIRNINEIPISLIESFAQNFLLTHELNIQINKLIISNFNTKKNK